MSRANLFYIPRFDNITSHLPKFPSSVHVIELQQHHFNHQFQQFITIYTTKMSYPQSNPTAPYEAQPQHTGVHAPDIETAPPTYPATTAVANEKHAYGTEQQTPQQTFQHGTPQQDIQSGTPHQSFQVGAGTTANKGNYQMATPLASLQQGPAPVDCPVCGVREMTRTEYVSGGTTQYVERAPGGHFESVDWWLMQLVQSFGYSLLLLSLPGLYSVSGDLVQGLRA